MAHFGNFCLLLAFCLSLYAFIAALTGISQKKPSIVRSSEHAVYAATACVTLAFVSLMYLLISDDFSIAQVANNSNRDLPSFYKITAIWGAHDGSMLLWVFVTALFCCIAVFQNRSRYREMMPYVIAVLMVDLSFFLYLNLFLSNPFQRLVEVFSDGTIVPFVPADGQGLNPILQHWAMVIHPPIQYIGLIGFIVPFAFAIGALSSRQLGNTWIRTTRRWTITTWIFLGAGLMLGGKWAYVVLGWGGYWGWDPIENSSLMPWLVSTAFLHSVIVQERKGMLKKWNIVLIMLTYLLGIFSTFLTRSGIVSSVHAFTESTLGIYFVVYMALILVGTLYLLAIRNKYLESDRRLDSILSRESAFFFNNLILVVFCFVIFSATMWPAFSEWITGKQISLTSPFFNKFSIPIGLMLLVLTGLGPLFAWRKTSAGSLIRSCSLPFLFSCLAAIGLLVGGMRNLPAILCLIFCVFVLVTIIEEFFRGTLLRSRSKGENFLSALVNLTLKNKRRYGGYIVHLSIVLMFCGFTGNAFNREATEHLRVGDQFQIGDYSLTMTDYQEGKKPNYDYGRVLLDVYKDGKKIKSLAPEKRLFRTGAGQTTTTVALYSTPKEDLYVVFAGMLDDGITCEIKANVNPLVYWIWIGAAIMVLGTIITLLPNKQLPVASSQ